MNILHLFEIYNFTNEIFKLFEILSLWGGGEVTMSNQNENDEEKKGLNFVVHFKTAFRVSICHQSILFFFFSFCFVLFSIFNVRFPFGCCIYVCVCVSFPKNVATKYNRKKSRKSIYRSSV